MPAGLAPEGRSLFSSVTAATGGDNGAALKPTSKQSVTQAAAGSRPDENEDGSIDGKNETTTDLTLPMPELAQG